MPKYSFYILPYFLIAKESVAISMPRIARAGYDAVELPGEPEHFDASEVRQLTQRWNLPVSSISGRWTPGRSLVSADPEVRGRTVEYLKGLATFANQVSASIVIVQPTENRSTKPGASRSQEWEWAATAIREAGRYAADLGVTLVLEPANRFETYLINRLDDAVALRDAVDLDNVGVMGDVFHLNIEEASIPEAITRAGKHLLHFHLCDNNRAAPGMGHVDFRPILRALKTVKYQGFLTMELLTPHWPHDAGLGPEFLADDGFPLQARDYITELWNTV